MYIYIYMKVKSRVVRARGRPRVDLAAEDILYYINMIIFYTMLYYDILFYTILYTI